jgi:hypothetical protein
MNNLTGLIPILFAALQIVSRELVGFIPAVSFYPNTEQVALNQPIRVPKTQEATSQPITPGSPPAAQGATFDYVDMMITKNNMVQIPWTGDEQLSIGGQFNKILLNQYTQAMRTLVNEVEVDVCLEATIGALSAGNVAGTAGVTPFATGTDELALINKMQSDIGVPKGDRQFVINTATGMALRRLKELLNVSAAGENDMLRKGVLNDIMGYAIRESGGFTTIDPGTQTSITLSANAPAGAKSIAVTALVGTLNVGAVINIAGNYYTLTAPAIIGATTLNRSPQIKAAVASATVATVASPYLPNVAFSRDFIYLATRNPAMPQQANKPGGILLDMISITDPVSGLSFQVCLFDAYRQIRIEIGLAWGVKAVNERHGLLLLG